MNDVSSAILECDAESMLELMAEVWHDERPATPDECETDWRHKFIGTYAEYLKNYYEDILNSSDLDPIIKYIIDYDAIDWNGIAKYMVFHTDKLDTWIEGFTEEYEKEKWDNMSDEEKADYYREIEGDRQYDSMIDDRIGGY